MVETSLVPESGDRKHQWSGRRFACIGCDSVVCALLLVPLTARADDAAPRKVALLVGVNHYLKPGFRDLEFAEADVQSVAAELKKLGFETTVLLGSGKRNTTGDAGQYRAGGSRHGRAAR